MGPRLLRYGLSLLPFLVACDRSTEPSNPMAPPGSEKDLGSAVLQKGASILQNLSPVGGFDYYLNGFHVMKNHPELHMEAHHYCRDLNDEFSQCVIFDGSTSDSNLVGVEYIISENLFSSLPEEEKRYWHPHNYEILSGQLVMPGVGAIAEKAALQKKLNSYGKTWHIWDTGHFGRPAANALPVGEPMLAWSYNRDGEAPEKLLEERDERLKVDIWAKREDRASLAPDARPQMGEKELEGRIVQPRKNSPLDGSAHPPQHMGQGKE